MANVAFFLKKQIGRSTAGKVSFIGMFSGSFQKWVFCEKNESSFQLYNGGYSAIGLFGIEESYLWFFYNAGQCGFIWHKVTISSDAQEELVDMLK